MRRGTPLTNDCQDTCTFFPIFAGSDYECGDCDPPSGPLPTVSPAPTPLFLEDFQIDLDLSGVPLRDRSYFRQARDTWTDIVTQGLPDFDSSGVPPNLLPESPCSLPSVIDDLYICIQIKEFDRKDDNVIASAAPRFARTKDEAAGNPGLPVTGFMSINEEKVNELIGDGIYQQVIEHELSHVLGFGTLWGREGLTEAVGDDTCYYRGTNAVSEYRALSRCDDLPLEGCGHWSDCMGRELLTATIDKNTGTALSRVTIAAMEDLGYVVDYSMADPSYTSFDVSISCRCFRRMDGDKDDKLAFAEMEPRNERKLLSDKGFETVYKYGTALLDEQEELAIALAERSATPEGVDFVGNRSVNVLYIEEGAIYSVTLRRDQ